MIVVGIDEVGRGSIAGPVVAAAVVLGKNKISFLKDSKKLSHKQRIFLSNEIKEKCIEFSVGVVSSKKIDDIN